MSTERGPRQGWPVGAGVLAAAILALVVTRAAAGTDQAADGPERVHGVGPQGGVPQFVVECGWSHAAPDDPIVHPGHAGRSHLHDFFGSTAVGADSTAVDLVGTTTTCKTKADTAAYWAPALLRHGEPIEPAGSVAYYRPGPGIDPAAVQAPPAGLAVVAGDPVASSPQPLEVAAWRCGASPALQVEPPACPKSAPLGVRVTFPDCWDGERVTAPDHRSHLARSHGGRCPATHRVPIAQLTFEVRYPVSGDPAGLELASGGLHSLHADFLNAWDPAALEREVRACLNGGRVCGIVSNRATG
jgi:hypothetical protein